MILEDLGFNSDLEKFIEYNHIKDIAIGRVIAEYKERYLVKTILGEYEAEITGNLRYTAMDREDFPAVGDWVALTIVDSDFAIILRILPRYSIIKRQSAGKTGDVQIIATNIDCAFIVQAVDRDFNLNRIERYLTICHASAVEPVILLTKIDLVSVQDLTEITESIKSRIPNVPIFAVSNKTKTGYEAVRKILRKGKTYCMLGSSGVGKSTLINMLTGKSAMQTGAISQSTNKGRHITTHRELIVLENSGILIDNPGMKEVGIADPAGGVNATFDKIFSLAQKCKFKDCAHVSEAGCAVREALERKEIDRGYYENYLKIQKEKNYFDTALAERRRQEKIFGKLQKDFNKRNLKRGK